MRESFIISPDKNNGYPSFSDALDFENVNFCQNKNMFIDDSIFYPRYIGKNIETETFSHFSKNTFFTFSDINEGYPVLLFWYDLKQKIISDIYVGENNAQIVYYRDIPVKALYFNEKMIYKFGFSE